MLLDDFIYENDSGIFEIGARRTLVTDGLFEAADSSGEEFGLERLTAALNEAGYLSLENMRDDALATVAALSGATFADDICSSRSEPHASPWLCP